jgi:hypothetical protein
MEKSEIMLIADVVCRWMNGTGDNRIKWNEPGSERQRSHIVSHMWKTDPKDLNFCKSHF